MGTYRQVAMRLLVLAGAALVAAGGLGTPPAVAGEGAARLAPGLLLGPENAEQAEGLLPPEILRHYRRGEYVNRIASYPEDHEHGGERFAAASRRNRGRLAVDARGTIVAAASGAPARGIFGLPFPDIDPADPAAGVKVVWNYVYTYWANSSSYDRIDLSWVSPRGVDRKATEEVYYLYYEGQPPRLAPPANPNDLLLQTLARTVAPQDLWGTTALSWRYRGAKRRDAMWSYIPAMRRVRQVSPTNRSDGFLGSDMSQDDGPFFDGKPEDFTWQLVGLREALRLADPFRLRGGFRYERIEGGGWRALYRREVPAAGFQKPGWRGVPWAPVSYELVRRRFWVVEGVPRDRYYLYGKIRLYIDDETFQGAWSRKFDWKGNLLNTFQVPGGPSHSPDGVLYFDQGIGGGVIWWTAENVKLDRATVVTTPEGFEDRAIPLKPAFFEQQTLVRLGR